MTAHEHWRCNGHLADGRYLTLTFQGMVPDTNPEATLGEGDRMVTVELTCSLVPLGDR